METDERRIARRLPAGENRASLQWAGGAGFLNSPARLVDISESGASFVAVLPPPQDAPVWLRIEFPKPLGWVLARVVRNDGQTAGALCFSGNRPVELLANLT